MGQTCIFIFPLNVKKKFSEQLEMLDVPTAVTCFLCGQFKKHLPDSLLSSRFLYILISSSKKAKEPELSDVLPPKCSAFPFKEDKHRHCTSVLSSWARQEAGDCIPVTL